MNLLLDRELAIFRAQRAALLEFGVRVVTDVVFADEPIQLVDAYRHCRIDYDSNGSNDDAWLTDHIPAAREYCERYLGRALAPRVLELASSAFPSVAVATPPGAYVELPFGPVTSIVSVTYVDADGTTVDAEDSSGPLYELDEFATPSRLVLAYGKAWPSARASTNSVRIRYAAGYVAEADSSLLPVIPRMARAAIRLMLAHLYENREATFSGSTIVEIPLGVRDLLDLVPNRERLGFA